MRGDVRRGEVWHGDARLEIATEYGAVWFCVVGRGQARLGMIKEIAVEWFGEASPAEVVFGLAGYGKARFLRSAQCAVWFVMRWQDGVRSVMAWFG